ncbi:hypothetical protein FZEAL_6774 [Fusarium zealandicum]|uniref:Uncharacterized protein n=1 Tax=Fusarium zealandicum TaxID=1053134 RepID=A0A8H4XIG7_9HYPO|nr:hypothetical protein FZEAL_6774 [Fusarium zealandicum]
MHGLLAVSSLHYAHYNPALQAEYRLISTHYHGLALLNFRERLNNVNEENCEIYFLLASLIFTLSMTAVANPPGPRGCLTPGEVAQSLQLLQGIKCMINYKSIEEWSAHGSLAPLFRPRPEGTTTMPIPTASSSAAPVSLTPFEARLDKLCLLARQLPRSLDIINPQSACLIAIESLRNTYLECRATDLDQTPAPSWNWPLTIPHIYIDMVSAGNPVALVILAHYAAISWPFEHHDWASQGWGASLIGMIEAALEDEWQHWITWPMQSLKARIQVDSMGDD